MYRPPKSGQPGAYVVPNARKEGTDAQINTGNTRDFPVLNIVPKSTTEALKKPAPISFAALLKSKVQQEETPSNSMTDIQPKRRLRVVDMPDDPDIKEDKQHFANFKKLEAARQEAKQRRMNELRPPVSDSSSEEEIAEDHYSEEFWSDDDDDANEHDDTYDASEFDRHR